MERLHLLVFLANAFKQAHHLLNINFLWFISMFNSFHLFFFLHIVPELIVNSNLGLAHLLTLVILLNS